MKLALLSSSFLAVFAIAACATSSKVVVQDGTNPDGGPAVDTDGGTTTPPESDDPANQPPHSLGTIVLGESHASGAGTSTPIVSATFFPDALLTRACSTKLEGSCTIQAVPKCTSVSTSSTGCNSNEACTLDKTTCTASCKPFAVCETTCASDEVCKATGTGTGGTGTVNGTCVKSESFDAGPLAFSGTTTEITMFPPYKFTSTGQGAPFLGGAQLHVQASGAVGAGFDKFDEMFTATTFIQTSPSLAMIPRQLVFGAGALPIGWAPGSDTVIINISGSGGTATCKVDDSVGNYAIPRSVIQAAQGATGTTGSSSISISVARQKKDVKKDQHAKGTLTGTTIQPDGWLELVTLSTESASFQGCAAGQGFCGSSSTTCTDLQYDEANCGKCGNICASGSTCSAGTCTSTGGGTSCTTCRQNAESGSCSSYYSTCSANASCYDLAYCAASCTTSSCVASCESSYSAGYTQWSPLKSCLTTYCSSTCGF